MQITNTAKSPRRVHINGGVSISLLVGETKPITAEQLEQVRAKKVGAYWLKMGDMKVLDSDEAVADGPFSSGALLKAADKLTEAGYESAEQVAEATIEELTEISGIGEPTAVKLIAEAKDAVEAAQ